MAFLGDIADPDKLVRDTHRELMDKLGSNLTPANLVKMAEGKDPFAVPEQAGTDLASLAQRLKEFEAMVRGRGWDTPTVRETLLTDLRLRGDSTAKSIGKIDVELEKSWQPYTVERPYVYGHQISPDGRYLITHVTGIGPSTIHRYDMVEKKALPPVPVTGPTNFTRAIYSETGDAYFVGGSNGQLFRAAVNGSEIDFANMTKLGTLDVAFGPTQAIHPSGDSNVVFAELRDTGKIVDPNDAIYRFDVSSGKRVRVDIVPKILRRDWQNWGTVPGSQDIWVTAKEYPAPNRHRRLQ